METSRVYTYLLRKSKGIKIGSILLRLPLRIPQLRIFREDPWFANQLHCRWDEVYATVMSPENMNEMSYLRGWIGDRLNWMNDRWGGMCLLASDQATQLISDPRLKVFPNPSDLSHTYLSLSHSSASELSIRLYDLSGKRVYQSEVFYSGYDYAFQLPDLSSLPSGMYTLEVTDGQSMREITKLLKQ